MSIRSPICTVVGHVDHGKSSILDAIRGTAIVAGEAGAITQAIGASIIPLETMQKQCGKLLKALNMEFTIPGLLFIDTPGHAAFTSLRKRGSNLADIAILVVDMREGFKPQTVESVEILKSYKTPFIIAANKIDLISGWQKRPGTILQEIAAQQPRVLTDVETKLYEIVGKMSELGLESERFDRVTDYTKQVAIVPVSAKTQEGLPELMMVLVGLAQKYLEASLQADVSGTAKGTVLEVKDEKGMGKTMDVILYDGALRVGDTLVIGGLNEATVTKVRGLFQPMPLAEMMDKKAKYTPVKEAVAATGVKIAAPDIQNVVAGMPVRSCDKKDVESVIEEVQSDVEDVIIETEEQGIIIKTDTLGSLEALICLLRDKGIPIRRASIGDITKRDLTDAETNYGRDPLQAVILGFNVTAPDSIPTNVKIILSDIIYRLIDDYEAWVAGETMKMEEKELDKLVRPCKMRMMTNYIFRQNNPAVVGVDILIGKIKAGSPITKDGSTLTVVKSIQHEKDSVSVAEEGKQVAVSLPNVTVGRHIFEEDIFFADIPEDDFKKLKEHKKLLKKSELSVMRELAEMKRDNNPVWGI